MILLNVRLERKILKSQLLVYLKFKQAIEGIADFIIMNSQVNLGLLSVETF